LKSLTNFEQMPPAHYSRQDFRLDRMQKMLVKLGHPQKRMRTIHIAGTKGKGSIATMVACMLQNCGYKVGLYTSPHLISVRERMTINRHSPDEKAFTKALSKAAAAAAKVSTKTKPPTYFEIITATAFVWFAENEVDVAVVEAGLGGRLDSTNVITPEVCGITSISLDHTRQLGNTLAAIAEEKAGIIKKGVPVVSAPQRPEVVAVLRERAAKFDAPFSVPGEDNDLSYRFESSRAVGPHTRLSLTTPRSRFEHLHVPLPGEHQAINCSVALTLMDALKGRGFKIDDQKAIEGLANVRLSGRMEMVCDEPRVLVDGAHNASSVEALMRAIGQSIPYDSMVVIFACQKDKDIPGMLRHVQLGADKIIFTSTDNPRSADPHELLHMFQEKCGKMAQVADTLGDALAIASSAVTREDLICITGSFYIAGLAKRLYARKKQVAAAT
jgi:dihydrofolate synthase/folylpolyglutamate synthase